MTQQEMTNRFDAYQKESTAFIMSPEWVNMTWQQRDAIEAEIDARHHYKHGWIIVDGFSFDISMAYPDQPFYNVWD